MLQCAYTTIVFEQSARGILDTTGAGTGDGGGGLGGLDDGPAHMCSVLSKGIPSMQLPVQHLVGLKGCLHALTACKAPLIQSYTA